MRTAVWSKEVIEEMEKLRRSPKRELKQKLSETSDNTLMCTVEALCNILSGNVKIKPAQKKSLKPFIREIRQFARIRDVEKARSKVQQRGAGFFLPLLPVLVSVAASVLQHVLQ